MGRHTDRELIAALKQVHLWDVLCGLSLSHAKAGQSGAAIMAPRQPGVAGIGSLGSPASMPVGESWSGCALPANGAGVAVGFWCLKDDVASLVDLVCGMTVALLFP